MTEALARYLHFFWAGVAKQGQTGGIVPSQKYLIRRMIAPVPEDYTGQVIELGPGTGALTLRLAARCARAKILACEINPVLAKVTREAVAKAGFADRVKVVNDSAENFLSRAGDDGIPKPEFIISGIPLGALPRQRALSLISAIHGALVEGGLYIQFQHSYLDRKKIESNFSSFHTTPVLLNFPPAVVYYARK